MFSSWEMRNMFPIHLEEIFDEQNQYPVFLFSVIYFDEFLLPLQSACRQNKTFYSFLKQSELFLRIFSRIFTIKTSKLYSKMGKIAIKARNLISFRAEVLIPFLRLIFLIWQDFWMDLQNFPQNFFEPSNKILWFTRD